MPRHALLLAALITGAVPALRAQATPAPDSVLLRRARALHRLVPVFDGHNDLPWKIRGHGTDTDNWAAIRNPMFALDSLDLAKPQPALQTDIPRLRAGGVGAQFWSTWVPNEVVSSGSARIELEQIDIVHRMVARYPRTFLFARTAADVERAHREGKIASLIGIEGGHAIENSLPVLRAFYDAGARYMTLTHNTTLAWADAALDTARHNGLTPFGYEVVREMNRLGMLVDLAHVSDSVMAQVLRTSAAPVIFSHSSARALADHPRNVPDDILRLVPANGGVVLVNFYCDFVSRARVEHNRARAVARTEARGRLGASDTAGVRAAMAAWDAAHPEPPASTIGEVADHIDHIRQVAGIDHVGYGSDFDGIDCAPRGLEDVSRYPYLTAELLRRGYSEADVKKVVGLNLLRVLRQAEAVSVRLRRERGPSTATLAGLDSTGVR